MSPTTSRKLTAVLAGVAALGEALLPRPAHAQTPQGDPLPKSGLTERQSQQNPAPKVHGDNQNRGRMTADYLWGITNANRTFVEVPYVRLPNQTIDAPLQDDGWTTPYPVNAGRRFDMNRAPASSLLYLSRTIDDEPGAGAVTVVTAPVAGGTALGLQGSIVVGANWGAGFVSAPSTNFIGTGYHRLATVPRPAGAPSSDPTDLSKFSWYPNIRGLAGTSIRLAVRVHIPTLPADTSLGIENRITDARYVVYYAIRDSTTGFYYRKRKVCFLSQDTAGDFYLTGSDGQTAYFPFFANDTYISGGSYADGTLFSDPFSRSRVELDNTTENTGDNLFVLADQIEFVERPTTIKAAPVVVAPHGGRKVDTTTAATATLATPYQQPAARDTTGPNTGGPSQHANPYVDSGSGRVNSMNDSFEFINNPRDPIYDPTSPSYNPTIPFDPSNPSTLFTGPASLITPRGNPGLGLPPTAQPDPWNGTGSDTAPVNAYNTMQYRRRVTTLPDTYEAVPLFSHMQVIYLRTEYVADPETGVAPEDRDGSLTREVGSVTSVDWLTGTTIWRFPDRSYLPMNRLDPRGIAITAAGLRNPQIGTVPRTNPVVPIYQIPGIDYVDRNNDGFVTDDEVFIVGQGPNPGGGLSGAVTLSPNMSVFGAVQVPLYDPNTFEMLSTIAAPLGRYLRADPINVGQYLPVQTTVAYFGSNNGVVYAIDPFGNNDSRYAVAPDDATQGRLGVFRPGTTNLLWTFSPQSSPRRLSGAGAETLERYNRRLKTEVPVPGAFAGSSPVITWAKPEDDPTLSRANDEARLFIGNQNGVVYALDPQANAGIDISTSLPRSLPIRKGEQTFNATYATGVPEALVSPFRTDLKWWFETLGSINATPAVSAYAFPRQAAAAPVTESKGVYVTTGEGRVYCLDWHGPVTKADHEVNMVWNGQPGDSPTFTGPVADPPAPGSAAALNDNIKFRNDIAARPGAIPDLTEGTIRPRWVFPNRYRDIDATRTRSIDRIDFSRAYPGRRLAEPFTNISAILSAPVLMDFPYLDTDNPASLSGIRRYVVVATNDYNSDAPTSPRQGRLFLLDQEGNREDFLSNPVPSKSTISVTPPTKPTPSAGAVIYDQPLDQFISKIGPFGAAAPTWTYRSVYDTYDLEMRPRIDLRNQPTAITVVEGQPAKRILPTIFVGGQGRLYAIDIDERSGILLRWRTGTNAQPQPLPDGIIVPGLDALSDTVNPSDALNPANTILNVGAKNTVGLVPRSRIMARTIRLRTDGSSVDGNLVVSGGPVQNRNNTTARPYVQLYFPGTVAPPGVPAGPTVPPIPTDDPPSQKPVFTVTTPLPGGYDYALTPVAPAPVVLPIFDFSGRYVNQESDDPLATTRGTLGEFVVPPVDQSEPDNRAFQHPVLFVSTQAGFVHEVGTKIDGEDTSYATSGEIGAGPGRTWSIGWALVEGDLDRFDETHNLFWSVKGPGGSGSGIAVVTDAYFPSRDPNYARRADRRDKNPVLDPSSAFPFYPPGEPNTVPAAVNYGDDPRPQFKPRPLSPGDALGLPVILPDTHTGMTGFPLDMNGLFYDKQFAYDPSNVTSIVNNNAQGRHQNMPFALPAYSEQGKRAGNTVTTGNVESDFERRAGFTATGTINQGFNLNPAGQNVAWIFAGGDDGILYGYTPTFATRLGGQGSGFVGGQRNRTPETFSGQMRIDIFDPEEWRNLQLAAQGGAPRRPARNQQGAGLPLTSSVFSRAAKGEKNYFEWGDSVYVIVWDVNVVAPTDNSLPAPAVPANLNIVLNITSEDGAGVINRTFPLARFGTVVATYPYDRTYNTPQRDTPPGFYPAQLGIAFCKIDLTQDSGLPMAPGTRMRLTATAQPPAGANPNDIIGVAGGSGSTAGVLLGISPVFAVANPLAVQAFLADTTQRGVVASVPTRGQHRSNRGWHWDRSEPRRRAPLAKRCAAVWRRRDEPMARPTRTVATSNTARRCPTAIWCAASIWIRI